MNSMKKFFFLVFALAIVVPCFAGFDVSVFGGYTSVNLKTINDDMAIIYTDGDWAPHSSSWPDARSYKNKMGNAFLAGVEALYPVFAGLSAGARVEYIIAQTGGIDWTSNSEFPYNNWKYLFDASMLPVLAGLSYDFDIPQSGWSVNASAFGGWGFAFLKKYLNLDNYSYTEWVDFTGNSFAADLKAGVSYKISGIKITLNGGYRLANVQQMKSTGYTDPSYGDYWPADPAGTEYKDYNGKIKRNFDFSGLIADISLGLSF
jgi:hypothetical protein